MTSPLSITATPGNPERISSCVRKIILGFFDVTDVCIKSCPFNQSLSLALIITISTLLLVYRDLHEWEKHIRHINIFYIVWG